MYALKNNNCCFSQEIRHPLGGGTIDTVRHNLQGVDDSFLTMESLFPWHTGFVEVHDFERSLLSEASEVRIIKTHTLPDFAGQSAWPDKREYALNLVKGERVIYVVRDCRDVMVSMYFYVKQYSKSHQSMSFSDFLREKIMMRGIGEMNRIEYWKRHVHSWLCTEGVLAISYEELHSDYHLTLTKLKDYLGLRTNEKTISIPLRNNSSPKKISSSVSPRLGKVGDWKNHFSADDLIFLDKTAGSLNECILDRGGISSLVL